jgi:aminomethyltransferase
VANAANRNKIVDWMKSNQKEFEVGIEDVTESLCMIAFQGPMAKNILQTITLGDLQSLRYYHFAVMQASGARVLVSRTGYTGEDGFELYCGSMYLKPMWERILAMGKEGGVLPIGLGARDLLRLEASMPLYGHEMNEETTPAEACLDKFVDFNKRKFLGRTAMHHSTGSEFSRRLICFQMLDNSIPRAEAPLLFAGMPIGVVTSGAFSPALKKGIGMGFVDAVKSIPGTSIEVEVHGKPHPAEIVKRPFYRRTKTS